MFQKSPFLCRAVLAPAVIVCMVALPGCGSKVTADNFAKIHQGQTEADVEAILGKPTSSQPGLMPGMTAEDWKDGDKTISVIVANGVVFATDKKGF